MYDIIAQEDFCKDCEHSQNSTCLNPWSDFYNWDIKGILYANCHSKREV